MLRVMVGSTPLQKACVEAPAGSLAQLRRDARDCRACDLWKPATQTVFGAGPAHAPVVLISEQPGDEEDRRGKPFVGPSGRLLGRALAAAGVDRRQLYVTNAVKHFKFEQRGKRRLHQRADAMQQAACCPWLAAEVQRIDPRALVCLGAMAAKAVFGSAFGLMRERGQWRDTADGRRAFATVHPPYLLRMPSGDRDEAFAQFVDELRLINDMLDAD